MKKIAMIAVVAMVAGLASADLAVAWKSQAGAVTAPSGGANYLVGSRIDLIYSLSGAITVDGQYNVTLPDETVLATGLTGANSLWNVPGQTFVGDFSAGKFFTRVYESTGAAGEFFLDIAMADGVDYVFNPQDTGTVYANSVVSGIQNINANGTTVIPEPATFGLMGIAGMGLFLARKKSRR